MTKPRKPAELGAEGARLWRKTTSEFELSGPEIEVLRLACAQADANAALAESISADGAMVTDQTGARRLNRAVTELRLGRSALARLLDQLRLPAEEDEQPMNAQQRRASGAANVRWGRFRERHGPA